MFEEFTERKFNDYLKFADFSNDRINIHKLRNLNIPPYIINFFKCSYPQNTSFISREEFSNTLKKAIVFNINYIIKPKATILKFIFGNVETIPADLVRQKLNYFQFYNYYISHIENFINLNSPLVISINQIKHLIDEINLKILQEILNPVTGDTQRLNLIKLIYYFFLDLTENNPINIKLPKKILSVFFSDKEFTDIKNRIDGFFSDEIFIQEAIELIKIDHKKEERKKDYEDIDDSSLKDLVKKAKNTLINEESSDKDIKQTLNQDNENIIKETDNIPYLIHTISELKNTEIKEVELLDKKFILDESIYSENILFESQLNESVRSEQVSRENLNLKRLNEIFCEKSYRNKIIKKLFNKNEQKFKEINLKILDSISWKEASFQIEEYFNKNKIDYFSEEAIKFVDLLESHFNSNLNVPALNQGHQKS